MTHKPDFPDNSALLAGRYPRTKDWELGVMTSPLSKVEWGMVRGIFQTFGFWGSDFGCWNHTAEEQNKRFYPNPPVSEFGHIVVYDWEFLGCMNCHYQNLDPNSIETIAKMTDEYLGCIPPDALAIAQQCDHFWYVLQMINDYPEALNWFEKHGGPKRTGITDAVIKLSGAEQMSADKQRRFNLILLNSSPEEQLELILECPLSEDFKNYICYEPSAIGVNDLDSLRWIASQSNIPRVRSAKEPNYDHMNMLDSITLDSGRRVRLIETEIMWD